jgi:hypothetical protein
MAIRDLNIGTMKEHKLESHGKSKAKINLFFRNRGEGLWKG